MSSSSESEVKFVSILKSEERLSAGVVSREGFLVFILGVLVRRPLELSFSSEFHFCNKGLAVDWFDSPRRRTRRVSELMAALEERAVVFEGAVLVVFFVALALALGF